MTGPTIFGSTPPPSERTMLFLPIGEAACRPYGLDPRMRAYRVAAMLGMDPSHEENLREEGGRAILVQHLGHVVSPSWLALMRERPGHVLTHRGRPVLAHATRPAERAEAVRLFDTQSVEEAQLLTVIEDDAVDFDAIDQRHKPFVARADEECDLEEIERALYDAATHRVSDALTLSLLRLPGFPLTRAAARLGLTANMITALGALFGLLAFLAFWNALFGAGIAAAILYMLADTIDGKLAKITGTSSLWGRRLDALLDIVHPPFWYVGWMHGVMAGDRSLEPVYAVMLTAIILAAYAGIRLTEALFRHTHGFHLSLWRPFDSRFRLVAAKRNINILLLGLSLVLMKPEWGIQWVALWSLLTLAIYLVRGATAKGALYRGETLTSWMAPGGHRDHDERPVAVPA